MKTIILMAALLFSSQALADGFNCETNERDLNIDIYNHVNPDLGTRRGSVMIISDPQVQEGRQTIARFTDLNKTLGSDHSEYTANVDLRFNDSGRKGEYISGTRLGYIDDIVVDLDFTYGGGLGDGDYVRGALYIIKRNGHEISRDLTCTRYLKNK